MPEVRDLGFTSVTYARGTDKPTDIKDKRVRKKVDTEINKLVPGLSAARKMHNSEFWMLQVRAPNQTLYVVVVGSHEVAEDDKRIVVLDLKKGDGNAQITKDELDRYAVRMAQTVEDIQTQEAKKTSQAKSAKARKRSTGRSPKREWTERPIPEPKAAPQPESEPETTEAPAPSQVIVTANIPRKRNRGADSAAQIEEPQTSLDEVLATFANASGYSPEDIEFFAEQGIDISKLRAPEKWHDPNYGGGELTELCVRHHGDILVWEEAARKLNRVRRDLHYVTKATRRVEQLTRLTNKLHFAPSSEELATASASLSELRQNLSRFPEASVLIEQLSTSYVSMMEASERRATSRGDLDVFLASKAPDPDAERWDLLVQGSEEAMREEWGIVGGELLPRRVDGSEALTVSQTYYANLVSDVVSYRIERTFEQELAEEAGQTYVINI